MTACCILAPLVDIANSTCHMSQELCENVMSTTKPEVDNGVVRGALSRGHSYHIQKIMRVLACSF